MYTHTHIYTVCFTDIPLSYIHIYIYIYTVSPHRVEYLLYRTDSPLSYIYIHIYSVSPHSQHMFFFFFFFAQMAQFYRIDSPLSHIYTYTHTYILRFTTQSRHIFFPHRWPSFTTLGKPTIWMVTYPSPSHTSICTHTYTQMYCLCCK